MKYKYIYGPVLSRRLGYSLGIDIIPYKTCTFDCIYCQLGKTTNKTIERKEYNVEKTTLIKEIKSAIEYYKDIDYITFSGSGEPTLNSSIGEIIKEIKKITKIPIVVLTNGSLFYQSDVIESILLADIIIPSLDAGNEKTYNIVNRHHKEINFEKIISGLINLRKNFTGKIYLEVMLIKNINDSIDEITCIKKFIQEIAPDEVHLNTVERPPSEKIALPLEEDELIKIKNIIGDRCKIISARRKHKPNSVPKNISNRIVKIIERRPVNLEELSQTLGIHKNEVIKYTSILAKEDKLKLIEYKGEKYYARR